MTDQNEGDETPAAVLDPGVEQLQRAASDALAAARTFLDAAERVVSDPAAMAAIVGNVSSVVRAAGEAFVSVAAAGAEGFRAAGSNEEPDDGVERITVN